jgi:HSP20 family protein
MMEASMASDQELQVQRKREVDSKQETTVPARAFETEEALTVIMEMPGVAKENVDVNVENDVLTIEGRIDFSKYERLQPVYTEYNVGHYARTFRLSSKIDQDRISADIKDDVMTMLLPKAEKARARRIKVS